MSYILITDDNKIYTGGRNTEGQAGTGSYNSGSSSYNYALYPPKEIVYETLDGTILDGSMIKDYCSNYYSSALVDNDGNLYTCGSKNYLGDSSTSNRYIFKKIEGIDNVDRVFCGQSTIIILKNDKSILATGSYPGTGSTSTIYNFQKVKISQDEDVPNNIKDISACKNLTVALDEDGYIYAWGSMGNNVFCDNVSVKYYATKLPIKNVVKAVATDYGIIALDKFGDVWISGASSSLGYNCYPGEFMGGSATATNGFVNISKSTINKVWYQDSSGEKYTFPKNVIDIFQVGGYPAIRYLDDNNSVNILTTRGCQKYLGAGTSPSSNIYWYSSSIPYDFENTHSNLFSLETSYGYLYGAFNKDDGKLYCTGTKGTNGTASDSFTALKEIGGMTDKNIVKVFSEVKDVNIANIVYKMPDINKAKVKIQSMI